MSNSKKILFEGRHSLLDPYLEAATNLGEVCVMQNSAKIPPSLEGVRFVPVSYGTFGFGKLFSWCNIEAVTPSYIVGFRSILAKEQPDIIVSLDFFRVSFWQALWHVKRRSDTKLFLYSETKRLPKRFWPKMLMNFFLWRLKKNIQYVSGVMVWTKEGKIWWNQNVPQMKVEIIPASVDISLFSPISDKVWLPDGTLRILMNARYVDLKDHRTLFRALAILKARDVKFKLSLIGRGGDLEESLLAFAFKLGIREHITKLETVAPEALREIYSAHDALVLPSYREAVGMVVPEAMACGLPTVTSRAVGANTYVVENKTGFIFETGKAEQLAQCLLKLTKPGLARDMGQAATSEILNNYQSKYLAKKFVDFLQH